MISKKQNIMNEHISIKKTVLKPFVIESLIPY